MPYYILRVEGVDFAETVDDTSNLSAYRGGSLALLEAPIAAERFLIENGPSHGIRFDASAGPVMLGASQGAFLIEADNDASAGRLRDAVERHLSGIANPPFKHLSLMVDIAAGDDLAALKRAHALNRGRQFSSDGWSLPAFAREAIGASTGFDPIRPATASLRVPKGRVNTPAAAHATHDEVMVSPSFRDRFQYGRKARQGFYAANGVEEARERTFTDSLQDMVADPPDLLPLSVRSKIAVFYADGNGFGAIRDKARSLAELTRFSNDLRSKQQSLLRSVVRWLAEGADRDPQAYSLSEDGRTGLRFETLLWGGDELCFVMPAWLGLEFLTLFNTWTADWKAPSQDKLTHGVGLVFCREKTPIRLARRAAAALADDAKSTLGGKAANVAQIEAFESTSPPGTEEQLLGQRLDLFRLGTEDADLVRTALTLRDGDIPRSLQRLASLKERFPRSQLYRLLRKAGDTRLFGAKTDDGLDGDVARYLKRAGAERGVTPQDLAVLGGTVPLAFSLAAAAGLWDYVDPVRPLVTEIADA